jgi:RND family efflux transporter MFP subunit
VAQAAAALSWFELTAPFAGRILTRAAEPGQMATPGRPLLVVYREDRLRFTVAVPEERAADLTGGGEYEIDFERLPTRKVALTRVLPCADPTTGTVTLRLELADCADLRPGLLGRLRLPGSQREALLVPAAAIERIGQVERVQLVRAGRVTPVTVRTGKAHGELVEILSGLAPGEVVLVP